MRRIYRRTPTGTARELKRCTSVRVSKNSSIDYLNILKIIHGEYEKVFSYIQKMSWSLIEEKTYKNMTQEKFKDLIEFPTRRADDVLERIKIKSVIARTLKLALQNPELAQEYLDSLPKAVCEEMPKSSCQVL